MLPRGAAAVLLAAVLSWAAPAHTAQSTAAQQIIVGADVQVSHDGDVAHVEQTIAASPVDPNVLLAAVTTFFPDQARQDHAYVSLDRGATWRGISFPQVAPEGSVDPGVTITTAGTMFFQTGYRHMTDAMFRSTDNGVHWQKIADGTGAFRLGSDATSGAFRGYIYRGLAWTGDGVQVEYSSDDGRTFHVGGRSCKGIADGLVTVADGTLLAICGANPYDFIFSPSSDGGKTFAPSRTILHRASLGMTPTEAQNRLPLDKILPPYEALGNPCAANAKETAYSGRLYCIFEKHNDVALTSRLYFLYSSDRGLTWSRPREVDPTMPQWASEVLPTIAVNREGTIGVGWLDTRASAKRDRYDEYFTASRDGGETFLPAVRVSSASSFPLQRGNMRLTLYPVSVKDPIAFSTTAYVYGREDGGDYSGIAADAGGDFHPIWPDSRTGAYQTYQLFTARIHVVSAGERLPTRATLTSASLAGKAIVLPEASTYDPGTRTVTMWVRIRNASSIPLFGPFTVKLANLFTGNMVPGAILLNASNGKTGSGATMVYRNTAGTLDMVPPGGVTEPILWRFRVGGANNAGVAFDAKISGFVKKPRTP